MYRTVLLDIIVVLFEKQRAALETKSQWIYIVGKKIMITKRDGIR